MNRWVKPHPKQPALDAPEWLRNEWQNGKNDIADLLSHCNFQRDLSRFGFMQSVNQLHWLVYRFNLV